MVRWFLIQFTIVEKHVSNGKVSEVRLPFVLRLIQAQTEAEAIAKFKMELEVNQEYKSHKNLTIL